MKNKREVSPESKSRRVSIAVNAAGIAVFLAVCAAVTVFAWPSIRGFFSNPDTLRDYVSANGLISVPVYLLLQILQVVVALIPGEALEIGAGYAFGWFWGFLLAEIGVALGTVVIFLVTRKLGRGFADAVAGGKKLKLFDKLDKNPRRDSIIFLIFLIPALPKDLLTYAAAFFDINIWKFIGITALARIPSIVTSTVAAEFLISGNYAAAAAIFIVTGVGAVVCFFLSEKIMNGFGIKNKKHGENSGDSDEQN